MLGLQRGGLRLDLFFQRGILFGGGPGLCLGLLPLLAQLGLRFGQFPAGVDEVFFQSPLILAELFFLGSGRGVFTQLLDFRHKLFVLSLEARVLRQRRGGWPGDRRFFFQFLHAFLEVLILLEQRGVFLAVMSIVRGLIGGRGQPIAF